MLARLKREPKRASAESKPSIESMDSCLRIQRGCCDLDNDIANSGKPEFGWRIRNDKNLLAGPDVFSLTPLISVA